MRSRSLSQRGSSLIEICIAMAIVGVVILGSSIILGRLSEMNNQARLKSRSAEVQHDFTKYLRFTLSQAVLLQSVGNNPIADNIISGIGMGQIRSYCYGCTNGMVVAAAPAIDTLAYFWREARVSAPLPTTSLFRASALFFQQPTPTQAGLVIIKMDAGPGLLTPNSSDHIFGSIVEFEIRDLQTEPDGGAPTRVSSVEIRWVQRRYQDLNMNLWGWCPRRSWAASCSTRSLEFKDEEFLLRIPFRNNLLGTVNYRQASANSSNPADPGDGNADLRLSDRTYFFQTQLDAR